jgi:hypothetical protein
MKAWFENPTWERHVLAADVPRPLNAACYDIDGDGIPEGVLAYRFESRPEQSIGNVVLLTHGKDARQPWMSSESVRGAEKVTGESANHDARGGRAPL